MFRSTVRNYQVCFTSQTVFAKINNSKKDRQDQANDNFSGAGQWWAWGESRRHASSVLQQRMIVQTVSFERNNNTQMPRFSVCDHIHVSGDIKVRWKWYKWYTNGALIWMVPSDLKHMAVDHIVKKQHLSCSLFKILPRAVHCPKKNKISCQSLVFRGDSSFQPCDSYPPPSTGCQSRVCPSYLCLFFIQNIPESEKCLFRRKFLIGQEPSFLVKL